MFGKSFRIFDLFGFSVRIDASWLLVLALVVWSLAGGVFPASQPGLAGSTYFVMALAAALGLFASIVFHELCHSLVARRHGLKMRGITLFLFGGVAEMAEDPPSPKAEFLMAAAGPAASVLVAILFLGCAGVGAALGVGGAIVGVLRWLGVINLVLVAFNLVPGFPLDGGRMLRAALWHFRNDLRGATRIASRVGEMLGLGLIGLGIVSLLLLDPLGGLWWILIGFFLRGAARASYARVVTRMALEGEPIRRFMTEDLVTVPPAATVEDLVENYVYRHHHKLYPVTDHGRLEGCVTTRVIREVPRERWGERRVSEIASACTEENTVSADEEAIDAFRKMRRHGEGPLMVVDHGRLVGVVSLRDMMSFLALKLELEDAAA